MRSLVFIPLAMLVGCAAQQWNKPGGTPEKLTQDRSFCQAKVVDAYPPKPEMLSVGWDTPPRRECNGPTKNDCVNVPGVPAAPKMVDVNEMPRQKGAEACLKALGWSR